MLPEPGTERPLLSGAWRSKPNPILAISLQSSGRQHDGAIVSPGCAGLHSRPNARLLRRCAKFRSRWAVRPTPSWNGYMPSHTSVLAGNQPIGRDDTCVSPLRASRQSTRSTRSFFSHLQPRNGFTCTKLTLPVDLLRMTIHLHRQSRTAFSPAVFQDFTPIGSRHSGAKAVHAHASSDFWLISSLRRHTAFR